MFYSIWNRVKELINKVDKIDDYSRGFTLISFDSNDVLEYGTTIDISTLPIVIRSLFKSDGYFYPQFYLNNCQYKK